MRICNVRIRRKHIFGVFIVIGLLYINNNLLQGYRGVRTERVLTCDRPSPAGIKLGTLETYIDDVINTNSLYDEPNYTGPVDLVYLWVNGSDPKFVLDLKRQKAIDNGTMYDSLLTCEDNDGPVDGFQVIVVYPALPNTDNILKDNDKINSIFNVTYTDFTTSVIIPKKAHTGSGLLNRLIRLDGKTYLTGCAYMTSISARPPSGVQLDSWYMAHGPDLLTLEAGLKTLNEADFSLQSGDKGGPNTYALIHGNSSSIRKTLASIMELNTTTIESAVLVFDPHSINVYGTPTRNRFADNDQLLYSLRSVEKYAPWIRHIFIVTNDQVPNWLNTSYPKVTVKSTADIFPNKDDLPTFSSPAIESHVHRIPELSETFLLSCDDFFFGGPVRLSHFYTPKRGIKIIMDSPQRMCSRGCAHADLGNGKCDATCNNINCGWDYGDCGDLSDEQKTHESPYKPYQGSLYRTMALFNRKYRQTKEYNTPPHLPLLINKKIAAALDNSFQEEFKQSSALHFRSVFNIQYTMAYLEFVMAERVTMTTEELFDELDKDSSGYLSYDEIENFKDRTGAREVFCGDRSKMTKFEFTNCECVNNIMEQANVTRPKYKFEELSSWDRHFITIKTSWILNLIGLMWVRLYPSTFNALNDNIDHNSKRSEAILKNLRDFYEERFPNPSKFERTDL